MNKQQIVDRLNNIIGDKSLPYTWFTPRDSRLTKPVCAEVKQIEAKIQDLGLNEDETNREREYELADWLARRHPWKTGYVGS